MLETVLYIPFWFELTATIVYAISGALSASRAQFDMLGTIVMATIVGLFGGVMRDVLLQEMPFVLKKRVYAVAAILGAFSYWALVSLGAPETVAYGAGWALAVTLRLLAMVFKWNLPKAI